MKQNRRMALIEPVGGHGGMSLYDLGLCRGVVAAGWNVSWYSCAETPTPNQPGVTFHGVFRGIWGKANRLQRAVRYLLGTLSALGRAVRSGERICHLHFFNGAPEELMLLLMARLFVRKVVLTVHDVESFAGSEGSPSHLKARLYQFAHRFVVHNETSRRELIAALQIPDRSIVVIPHGNYLDSLGDVTSIEVAKRRLGIGQSRKVILFFGQIKTVKGLDLLLEALPAVCRALPEATLLIAGRPWKNDFRPFEEMIQRLGLVQHCLLHIRYIPDEEVATFYASADVVVLPYRRIYQSGVLLLAMSYQKAVLVSDLPGMMDVVTPSVNGCVFATGSPTALADALIQVLHDDDERLRIAQEAFRYVRTKHDWRQIGKQLASLYDSLS